MRVRRVLPVGLPEGVDGRSRVLPAGIAQGVEHHQHQEVLFRQPEVRPRQFFVIGRLHAVQHQAHRLVRLLAHSPGREFRGCPHLVHIVEQRQPVIRHRLQLPLEDPHDVVPVKMVLGEGAQGVQPLRGIDVRHVDGVFVLQRQPVVKGRVLLGQVRDKVQVQQRVGNIPLLQRPGVQLRALGQADLRLEQAVQVDARRIPARFIGLGDLGLPDDPLLQGLADDMPHVGRNDLLEPHVLRHHQALDVHPYFMPYPVDSHTYTPVTYLNKQDSEEDFSTRSARSK